MRFQTRSEQNRRYPRVVRHPTEELQGQVHHPNAQLRRLLQALQGFAETPLQGLPRVLAS